MECLNTEFSLKLLLVKDGGYHLVYGSLSMAVWQCCSTVKLPLD
jgi:hypothetical protein